MATPPPLEGEFRPWQRRLLVITGAVLVAAGATATFLSDNGPGVAALLTVGAVAIVLGAIGDRLLEVQGWGFKVSARVRQLEAAAVRAEAAGNTESADELRARAQNLVRSAAPLARRYEHIREALPPSSDRTGRLEALRFDVYPLLEWATEESVADLFNTRHDGSRFLALILMQERPDLAQANLVASAVAGSRSAQEQYQALLAAERAWARWASEDRAAVLRAVAEARSEGHIAPGSDRDRIARSIERRSAR